MKKFLSLVLTLALTLSLVVLPARADVDAATGMTINTTATDIRVGETFTYTANISGAKVSDSSVAPKTGTEVTYLWTVSDNSLSIVGDNNKPSVSIKAASATTSAKVSCKISFTYVDSTSADKTALQTVESSAITVKAFTADDIDSITVYGRTYSVASNSATIQLFTDAEMSGIGSAEFGAKLKSAAASKYTLGAVTYSSNALTVKATNKATGATEETATVTISGNATKIAPTLTVAAKGVTADNTLVDIITGEKVALTTTYSNSSSTNESYTWSITAEGAGAVGNTNTTGTLDWTPSAAGTYTISCKVSEGSAPDVATDTLIVKVIADPFVAEKNGGYDSYTLTPDANTVTIATPLIQNTGTSPVTTTSEGVVLKGWASSDTAVATVSNAGLVTGLKTGTATITATVTYRTKEYKKTYSISVKTLDYTLDAVDNGSTNRFDTYDLLSYAQTALDRVYTGSDALTATSISSFGTASSGTLTTANWSTYDYVTYVAPTSVGKYTFTMTVNTHLNSNSSITGTKQIKFTIPVNPIETTFEDQNAGSATSYTVTKPSGYSKFWVISKNPSTAPTDFTNYSGAGGTSYTLGSSDFKSGKCVLYIVAQDSSNNKLYCGSITVYQQYIEYSGVSGEETAFEHEDFTEFLEDIADGKGVSSSRYPEFAYVKFNPLPNARTQGTLYYDGTAIKASDEIADLDKVTFVPATTTSTSSVNKTVSLTFQLYAYTYSGSTLSRKASNYVTGTVVINVISGNIKYTVPVDGTVTFKPYDFEDFYTDTYKNGKLSYVKFTELPKVADGALYATYSTLYAGTLAQTSDKFYYDSSKLTDLDLDDVTFRTSLWSKTGTKVYLPFEAYGTTTKNSHVSSTPVKGCVVITITAAKTMNFTDVTTAEWFYDNVKNAYTMGLIEGKTATTFNPNDNMTYAEAVTLAARMNQYYNNNGKVTLENSKTGNWYSSYESYAISKGIISSALGNKANTKITRRDYVEIFYNALPASAYTARNSITKIPDLANDSTNAKIYTFYKAGILTGYANTPGKTTGSFGANDNIKRSEVATILIRMMDSSTRMYFTL